MDDDFNTSLAISVLFELVLEINKHNDLQLASLLVALSNTIGILNRNPVEFFQSGSLISIDAIETLIKARTDARINKDFALADQIRQNLLKQGVILEDTGGVTTWRKE